MEDWRRTPLVFWVTSLPPSLWLIVFFLIPLALVWVMSFGELDGLVDIKITGTLANYERALDPLYLEVFGKSLLFAGFTTVISLVVAFPVALAIVFASPRRRSIQI